MKLPRDLGAEELITRLKTLGYEVTRQTGSHVRLTTTRHGAHHVTVPNHKPIRLGTLHGVFGEIATHFSCTKAELMQQLWD